MRAGCGACADGWWLGLWTSRACSHKQENCQKSTSPVSVAAGGADRQCQLLWFPWVAAELPVEHCWDVRCPGPSGHCCFLGQCAAERLLIPWLAMRVVMWALRVLGCPITTCTELHCGKLLEDEQPGVPPRGKFPVLISLGECRAFFWNHLRTQWTLPVIGGPGMEWQMVGGTLAEHLGRRELSPPPHMDSPNSPHTSK